MGDLKIVMNNQMNTTVVSNQFIDKYMPSANGEYVKIYLFVLRCVNHTDSSLSIQELAKKFDHTITYILNALEYWAKEGLIRLQYDGKELTSIEFLDLMTTSTINPVNNTAALTAVTEEPEEFEKKAYTSEEKDKFLKDKDFEKAIFVTQTYFKKLLGPAQLDSLMFIYDKLGYDSEFIDYLIEYCTSRGKRSMRYAETVAIEWKKHGISTVTEAKATTTLNSIVYYGIIKTFGISNRSLVEEERQYIDKWLNTYKMPEQLILEACKRTIKATNKPEFAYADKILKSWFEKNAKTLKDIAGLDESHQKSNGKSNNTKNKKLATSRDYNMSELEKKLFS